MLSARLHHDGVCLRYDGMTVRRGSVPRDVHVIETLLRRRSWRLGGRAIGALISRCYYYFKILWRGPNTVLINYRAPRTRRKIFKLIFVRASYEGTTWLSFVGFVVCVMYDVRRLSCDSRWTPFTLMLKRRGSLAVMDAGSTIRRMRFDAVGTQCDEERN